MPRRNGFPANEGALNLVARAVGTALQIVLGDVEGLKVGETAESSWNGTVELVIYLRDPNSATVSNLPSFKGWSLGKHSVAEKTREAALAVRLRLGFLPSNCFCPD